MSPDELYSWSDKQVSPQDSRATIGDAIAFLEPFIKADMDIIFFDI